MNKFQKDQKLKVLSADEADEKYIGKIGKVIDCNTFYYTLDMGDGTKDDPPFFQEHELTEA